MNQVKEGSLYKIIELYGNKFEIRYGYYQDIDRYSKYSEPIPIFPDFISNPVYANNGKMFVTHMQDKCINYEGNISNDSCYSCKYFNIGIDLIGTCSHPLNQRKELKINGFNRF